MRRISPIACSCFAAVLIAACASHRDLQPAGKLLDQTDLQSTRTFAANADNTASEWPSQEWWRTLGDSQLDSLLLEALTRNPSLAAAQARVDQAGGIAMARGAALNPDLAGTSRISRQRLSENGFFPPPFGGMKFTEFDIGLDLQYNFDFWGENRATLNSALNATHAAEVDRYAARLALAAGIVKTYIQLDRAYAMRDLISATLEQRKHLLELTQKRVQAGLDTQVDLKESDAALPQAQGDLIRIDQQIQVLGHQLAALCGQGPDRALTLTRPQLQLSTPMRLPNNVPANLVGRRPDVVAQRWRVEAAVQDIHAAEAAFYPNINLTAVAGFQSLGLHDLLQGSSHDYDIGPAIRLPIFIGGRLRGRLRASDAGYDLAVADYNATVIRALQEVADTLTTLKAIDAERDAADKAIAALQDAYNLAVIRYRTGLSNYMTVLIAEGQVLQQKQLQVDIEARRYDASISLIRALGGGFESQTNQNLKFSE